MLLQKNAIVGFQYQRNKIESIDPTSQPASTATQQTRLTTTTPVSIPPTFGWHLNPQQWHQK